MIKKKFRFINHFDKRPQKTKEILSNLKRLHKKKNKNK